MSSGLTIASQTIGFISFSITLLTLLGVYSSLLGTLRSAPVQIPITLGNLRQEILAERSYLRQRCLEGRDPFGVFPGNLGGLPGRRGKDGRLTTEFRGGRRGSKGGTTKVEDELFGGDEAMAVEEQGYARLLSYTIRDLWLEFQRLERPFLIKGGLRAKAIKKGDYWGDEDLEARGDGSELSGRSGSDEKDGTRRRKRRRRRRRSARLRRVGSGDVHQPEWEAAEEDLRREGASYYNTGFTHRFIWWQTKDDVHLLGEHVQKIQIRRMERDLFETDELVRMLVRDRGFGRGAGSGKRDRPGGGGDGNDSGSDTDVRANAIVRSRAGSRAAPARRGSTTGRTFREVEEVERVRRPAQSPAATQRQSDREANVAARRTDRRPRESTVEYEVLRPGGGSYVVVDNGRGNPVARGGRIYEEDARRIGKTES